MSVRFTVLHRDPRSAARTGILDTPHGPLRTPAFMPVGTKGAVKSLAPRDLRDAGAEIILSNVYHLALRPGVELIEEMGGLHRFMAWDGPLLTDSGGYQIFSLARIRKISDDGVEFQSHIDGQPVFLGPEKVVDIQERLGVDIAMPLDQPVPNPATRERAEEALRRTHEWFTRSCRSLARDGMALFGIAQGSLHRDLRARAVQELLEHDVPGVAVGGLSMGESSGELHDLAAFTASLVPEDKPRYLMGVGTPQDIEKAVRAGYDLFDCVLPTRVARTGWAYTSRGTIRIRNRQYARDDRPLDGNCGCLACRSFSRAYLRHCVQIGEILGIALISYHNVWFYMRLMERIRRSIEEAS